MTSPTPRAVVVRCESGHPAGNRWRRPLYGGNRAREDLATGRERIEVGGLGRRMTHEAQSVGAGGVDADDQEVGLIGGASLSRLCLWTHRRRVRASQEREQECGQHGCPRRLNNHTASTPKERASVIVAMPAAATDPTGVGHGQSARINAPRR